MLNIIFITFFVSTFRKKSTKYSRKTHQKLFWSHFITKLLCIPSKKVIRNICLPWKKVIRIFCVLFIFIIRKVCIPWILLIRLFIKIFHHKLIINIVQKYFANYTNNYCIIYYCHQFIYIIYISTEYQQQDLFYYINKQYVIIQILE